MAEGTTGYRKAVAAVGLTGAAVFLVAIPGTAAPGKPRPEKIDICHKGETITVSDRSLEAHLRHGDSVGACGTGETTTTMGDETTTTMGDETTTTMGDETTTTMGDETTTTMGDETTTTMGDETTTTMGDETPTF